MTDRIISTTTVLNNDKIAIFRFHVFEKSIKFDSHMAYAVSKNDAVYENIQIIEQMWIERSLTIEDIFFEIVDVFKRYERYLSAFYFTSNELDKRGRLIKIQSYSAYDSKNYMFFMAAKNKDSLSRITKTEFERTISTTDVADSYVENYGGSDRNVTYYNYKLANHPDKNCLLMVVDDDIKMGFLTV